MLVVVEVNDEVGVVIGACVLGSTGETHHIDVGHTAFSY